MEASQDVFSFLREFGVIIRDVARSFERDYAKEVRGTVEVHQLLLSLESARLTALAVRRDLEAGLPVTTGLRELRSRLNRTTWSTKLCRIWRCTPNFHNWPRCY